MDNVPVKPLIGECKKIVAVDIVSLPEMQEIEGMSDIVFRTFQMSTSMQQDVAKKCDLLVKLESLSDYWLLDTDKNKEIFEIGYNYTKKLDVSKLVKKWKIF